MSEVVQLQEMRATLRNLQRQLVRNQRQATSRRAMVAANRGGLSVSLAQRLQEAVDLARRIEDPKANWTQERLQEVLDEFEALDAIFDRAIFGGTV